MAKKIILFFFLLYFALSPEMELLKAATCCNSPCCQHSLAPLHSCQNSSDQSKRYHNPVCQNCFKAETGKNDGIYESPISSFKTFYLKLFWTLTKRLSQT